MPIPVDQDRTVVPTNFVSRAFASLLGNDLFFYVTQGTNELRVKSFTNANARALAENVGFVCVIQAPAMVHLYFTNKSGTVFYAPFTFANFSTDLMVSPVSVGQARTMSAVYASNAPTPVYALLVDDGFYHTTYTSATPDFASILSTLRVFNNAIDLLHYVTEPVMTIHPDDTSAVTVHARQIKLSDNSSRTGFYCFKLPGGV